VNLLKLLFYYVAHYERNFCMCIASTFIRLFLHAFCYLLNYHVGIRIALFCIALLLSYSIGAYICFYAFFSFYALYVNERNVNETISTPGLYLSNFIRGGVKFWLLKSTPC